MQKLTAQEGRQADRAAFMARPVDLNMKLPGHINSAIEGECARTFRTRSQVVADLLAWALPRRLAEDLAHPTAGTLVDVDYQEAPADERPRFRQRSSISPPTPSSPPTPPRPRPRQTLTTITKEGN